MRPTRQPLMMLTAFWLLVPALVGAGGLPFDPGTAIDGAFDGASHIELADLDRDGDLDVVGTAINADDILWWENQGSGAWVEHPIWTNFDEPLYVATGDLNNDGWLDVIAVGRGADSPIWGVQWFENPAGGPLWTVHLVAFEFARSVRVADLDRDGQLDVIVAGPPNGHSIRWYRNMGDGATFTPWNIDYLTSSFGTAHSVFVGDVDGDGLLDVASASYVDDEIAWWRNDGTIECHDCWVKTLVEVDFDGADYVTGGDFDEDGDLDLAATAYGDDDVAWFENEDGDGSNWDTHTFEYFFDGAHSIEAVDMDLDGDLDLLSTARVDDDVVWFENTLPHTSWTTRLIQDDFDGARSAAAGDLDGDGDIDVIAACEFGDGISSWENRAIHRTAYYPSEFHDSNLPARSLIAIDHGDIDGDGDIDLFGTSVTAWAGPDVILWQNTATGWSWGGVDWDLEEARSIRGGDLDGDGDLDLVVGASGSDVVNWYQQRNIPGIFFDEFTIASGLDTHGVDIADVDGDGDQDVLGIFYAEGWVGWWENDLGDGSSWTERSVGGLARGHGLRAADIDLDGDIDVAVTSLSDDRVAWFENNNGLGTSWTRRILTESFDGANSIEVADVNGDGWPDLVAAANQGNTVAWWESQGNSTPTFVYRTIDTTLAGAFDVAPADLDQDGDLDVVCAGGGAHEVRWFENRTGSGTVWGSKIVESGIGNPAAVAVADFNGDGDADIAAVAVQAAVMMEYDNRGGQHSFVTIDLSPESMGDSEVAPLLRLVPLHKGLVDDVDMELRTLNLRIDDGAGTALTNEQIAGLIEELRVYWDSNGNHVFEAGVDAVLAIDSTITVGPTGYTQVNIPHGGSNPPLAAADFSSFFLVVQTAPTATTQAPGRFRITHLRGGAASAMRYYDWDTVYLKPQIFQEVSATVSFSGSGDEIFSDGFETGDTSRW